jgi:hypothetical protein
LAEEGEMLHPPLMYLLIAPSLAVAPLAEET